MQIEIKHVRKDIRLFEDEGKICWDHIFSLKWINKQRSTRITHFTKKKKKWRQVKHAKQSGEILSLTTCSVHYLPLNTHMFNLCPMTSESPTSFRLCVSRSTICTSLSSLYYSVNCAMLTSRKPAPWCYH